MKSLTAVRIAARQFVSETSVRVVYSIARCCLVSACLQTGSEEEELLMRDLGEAADKSVDGCGKRAVNKRCRAELSRSCPDRVRGALVHVQEIGVIWDWPASTEKGKNKCGSSHLSRCLFLPGRPLQEQITATVLQLYR